MSSISQFPLGGDGVCGNLFYYLWCKDEDDVGPNINIPDTIIYMYCQPAYWYFTSRDRQIRKKNRANLTVAKIEAAFTRSKSGSDIVAYFLSTVPHKDGTSETTIEYFNAKTLHDFLYSRQKVNNGILQKFVEPKGVRNAMIRSIWSPKVCLLERRVNIRKLNDLRFDMYERAVTYEGVEVNSKAAPVRGTFLPTKVQMLNDAVVSHTAEVSFHKYKINRMVLNFKTDSEDRLWLLWASSIRLEGAPTGVNTDLGPINIDMNIKVPKSVRLSASTAFNTPVALRRTFTCPSCVDTIEPHKKCNVNYKTIIKQYEQALYNHAQSITDTDEYAFAVPELNITDPITLHKNKVGLGTFSWDSIDNSIKPVVIPPVISAVHPKLGVEDYLRYRRDPLFLFKHTAVCESCFLAYADIAVAEMEQPLLMPGTHSSISSSGSIRRSKSLSISQMRRRRGNSKLQRSQIKLSGRKNVLRSKSETRRDDTPEKFSTPGKMPEGMPPDILQFDKDLGRSAPGLATFSRIDLDTLPEDQRDSVIRKRAGSVQEAPGSAFGAEDHMPQSESQVNVRIPPKSDPLYHVVKTEKDISIAPSYKLPELRGSQNEQRKLNQISRLSSGGSKMGSRRSRKMAPYSSAQTLKHANGTMIIRARASLTRDSKRKSGQSTRRSSGRRKDSSRYSGDEGVEGYEDVADISNLSESALEHRNFLMETLKQVKRQLEVPETLLVGQDDYDDDDPTKNIGYNEVHEI